MCSLCCFYATVAELRICDKELMAQEVKKNKQKCYYEVGTLEQVCQSLD